MTTPEPPDPDPEGGGGPLAAAGGTGPVLSGDVPDHVAVEVDAPGMPAPRAEELERAVAEAFRQAGTGSVDDLGKAIASAVARATDALDDSADGASGSATATAIGEAVTRAFPKGRIVAIGILVVVLIVGVNIALQVADVIDTTSDIVRDIDVSDVVPRAESIELIDDGKQLAAAIDEIAKANGSPTAVDVTVYPEYLLACMVSSDGAAHGYRLDAHGLDETNTLCATPGDGEFSVRRVAWESVPRLAASARARLGGEPGDVTHVILDRSLGSSLEIRVYFRADSGAVTGYVRAGRDGTVTAVCC